MKKTTGFSLTSLLIGLAVSSLLIAGLLEVFANTKAGFNSTQNLTRVNENARFATEIIEKYISSAGYLMSPGFPEWPTSNYANTVQQTNPFRFIGCLSTNDAAAYTPVLAANTTITDCLNELISTNTTVGVEVLTLESGACQKATPYPSKLTNTTRVIDTNCDIDAGGIAGGGANGRLAYQLAVPWIEGVAGAPNQSDSLLVRYTRDSALGLTTCSGESNSNGSILESNFFVDANTNELVCTGSAYGLDSPDATRYVLAQNVEYMRIKYGIDDSGNGSPNRYIPVNSTGFDWSKVVSVQLGLVVRTEAPILTQDVPQRVSILDETYPISNLDPISDSYARRVYSITAPIFNGNVPSIRDNVVEVAYSHNFNASSVETGFVALHPPESGETDISRRARGFVGSTGTPLTTTGDYNVSEYTYGYCEMNAAGGIRAVVWEAGQAAPVTGANISAGSPSSSVSTATYGSGRPNVTCNF